MKRLSSYGLLFLGLLILLLGLKPASSSSSVDILSLASLPVQAGGRVKPLDTVARNALRLFSGRQVLRLPSGERLSAARWLSDVLLHPEVADAYPVFRIDNDQVLGFCGLSLDRQYVAFSELEPLLDKIQQQVAIVLPEHAQRSVFERRLVQLSEALLYYQRLRNGLYSDTNPTGNVVARHAAWLESIRAVKATVQGQQHEPIMADPAAFGRFGEFLSHYQRLKMLSPLGIVPPRTPEAFADGDWDNAGESLIASIDSETIDPVLQNYAALMTAYRRGKAHAFNEALAALHNDYKVSLPAATHRRLALEAFYNDYQPFYQSLLLYLIVFVAVSVGWLLRSISMGSGLQSGAFGLLFLAFAIHSVGLAMRMYLQGRPPVTNLYSSAVFVGWVAVGLGIVLERFSHKGIGSLTAALIGAVTLIIAHNLSTSGDTLEMMRAVLDSNFWLATHVITITVGYGAMFLSGVIATIALLRGAVTRSFDATTAKTLSSMVYGVVCFATLFSFVGTLLGGIWADRSWGRFWGWDPKENGALLIVLWCAIILHARWGKLVSERGLMIMAVFGNIVTAWSWFGTNMLGIGLHAYGFIDRAFFALLAFIGSQLLIMLIGCFTFRVKPKEP